MAERIAYNGEDKWKIRATTLLNQGGSGSGGGGLSLGGRKFIFIGDSYQEGWTDSSGTTVIIDSWLDYFISWYGSEFNGYYRNEAGGWGFAKENCQFITLLQALESTITDKGSITDIVVEGGFNDHAYLSGIDSAIFAFRNYARQTYPNATLWIAPVSRGINQFEADADAAHKIYIDSGMKYGFNICGEITRVMLNEDYYSTDLVHPTADGYKQICKYMHQCLTTGACDLLIGYAKEDDIETNYYTKNDIDRALQSKANTSDLAPVATSGSYTDLSNKPYLGTAAAQNYDTELDQLSNNLITNSAVTWGLLDKASLSDLDNYYTKSQTYDRSEVDVLIDIGTAQKQDTLTEGNGIEINQNSVIWVKDTAYRFAEGSVDGAFQVSNPSGVPSNIPVHNVIRHGGTLEATQDNPIDFNDATFRGANARHIYWIGINQYVSNAPVANGSYGNFECYGSMQRFSRYRQTGCGQAFQRHYMNGAWSPWMRMNQDIHTIETDDMTTAVTLTSGSYGTLASVTLSAGIWQLNARASFTANATGNRAIIVTNSSTSTSSYDSMYVRVPSAGGSHTTGLCVSGCFELAQQTTLYLRGFQNSGGNLNASSASIRAIRIA